MKPLNAWFGIPFLKGYSVFKTTTIHKNLQRQQGPLLAWAVDSEICFYGYFCFVLWGFVCFAASAGQRTVIKICVQLEFAKSYLKIDD